MAKVDDADLCVDMFGEFDTPRRPPTDFALLAEKALSRRGFLGRSASFGAAAFLLGTSALTPPAAHAAGIWLSFEPVAANGLDSITMPQGFSWHTVAAWGDPLWSRGAEFDHVARGTGASQELAFGDNNDGMVLFTDGGRSILAVNNEFVNLGVAFANRSTNRPETADDIRKSKAGHGVSIFEIEQNSGIWSIVKVSRFNRRITADTPMEITGPARGHKLMCTTADPTASTTRGTWANCGSGRTPFRRYCHYTR